MPVYDFHTHSFLSDGVLAPMELIRRAYDKGYRAIAITDHVGLATQERVVPVLVEECARATARWDIIVIPGVEITHVPAGLIPEAAERAKALGARLVVVHGETIVEPVEPGSNASAVGSSHVDILAHPGLLTLEVARAAARRGVYLEVSARRGHSLTNGHVVNQAKLASAQLLLDSDAHTPEELLTAPLARQIGEGAGLDAETLDAILDTNPRKLLKKLGFSLT
ncbi:MAG: histidinol phosphate phosphatase domain-containing protein [Chloroflexi bacterium]|nr:histidinol phosphate phosphatase domain-containing protein [Chloroflexota bacterium]